MMNKILIFIFCLLVMACNSKQEVDEYALVTIDKIVEGSGITLPEYKITDHADDKNLLQDGWGQQIWWIKIKQPYWNKFKEKAEELSKTDKRWSYYKEGRAYIYDEHIDSLNIKSIEVSSEDDNIVSLSYEWEYGHSLLKQHKVTQQTTE